MFGLRNVLEGTLACTKRNLAMSDGDGKMSDEPQGMNRGVFT
jgi:hypothetical protein